MSKTRKYAELIISMSTDYLTGGITETHYLTTLKQVIKQCDINVVSHHVKKENIQCSSCVNCDLYENQTSSGRYFCKLTEEFINDIEQHYCDDYKPE